MLGLGLAPILISCERQKAEQLTLPEPPQPQTLTSSPNENYNALARERDNYINIDLNQLSDEATLTGTDPKLIAQSVFGSKEPIEGNFQEEVLVETRDTNLVIVTITQLGLPDDSVSGVRYRIEFASKKNSGDSLWQMIWAGRQQTCQEGRGSSDWTTENCL